MPKCLTLLLANTIVIPKFASAMAINLLRTFQTYLDDQINPNFSIRKNSLLHLCSSKTVGETDNPSAFIRVSWPAEDRRDMLQRVLPNQEPYLEPRHKAVNKTILPAYRR